MLGRLTLADHRRLGGQDCAAARQNLHLALAAGAAAATGRCDQDAFFREALHQLAADGNGEFTLVVDEHLHVTAGNKPRPCRENDEHEHEDDRCKQRHAKDDLGCDRGVQS
jgi:hypothetical protein